MKHLLLLLFVTLSVVACKDSEPSLHDKLIGKWDYAGGTCDVSFMKQGLEFTRDSMISGTGYAFSYSIKQDTIRTSDGGSFPFIIESLKK